jgi:hypothetical protein
VVQVTGSSAAPLAPALALVALAAAGALTIARPRARLFVLVLLAVAGLGVAAAALRVVADPFAAARAGLGAATGLTPASVGGLDVTVAATAWPVVGAALGHCSSPSRSSPCVHAAGGTTSAASTARTPDPGVPTTSTSGTGGTHSAAVTTPPGPEPALTHWPTPHPPGRDTMAERDTADRRDSTRVGRDSTEPSDAHDGHSIAAWVCVGTVMLGALVMSVAVVAALVWVFVVGAVVVGVGMVLGKVLHGMGFGEPALQAPPHPSKQGVR